MREDNPIVLPIHGKLDSFEVNGVRMENSGGSLDNGLPNTGGKVVDTIPLLMSTEITERLERMRGGTVG